MAYIDKVLQPGEVIRHMATVHWVVYLPGAALFIVALLLVVMTPPTGLLHTIGMSTGLLLLAASVYMLIRAWLRQWTTEYVVTDKRVVYKQGLIWRRTMEMQMDKISSVDVDQSIVGRLFDYGVIKVHGAGTDIQPIARVRSPLAFRNAITAE